MAPSVGVSRVLGLDLSLTATGVCLPDGSTFTIKTRTKDGDRRLLHISQSIVDVLADVHFAVVEDLPTHAHGAGITGMVQGVVRTRLLENGIPYALVVPATLKKFATGKGNADKTGMAIAALKRAQREFPDDNQCDAAWLRWAGLTLLGQSEFDMPVAQREALRAVSLPPGLS